MTLTLDGMVTVVNCPNVKAPIVVTPLGIIVLLLPTISLFVDVSMIALQLSRESNTGLLVSTLIFPTFKELKRHLLS